MSSPLPGSVGHSDVFGKMFRFSAHVLIRFFFLVELHEFSIRFGHQRLIRYKYFLPFGLSSFRLWTVSFAVQKPFGAMWSRFISAFGVNPKNHRRDRCPAAPRQVLSEESDCSRPQAQVFHPFGVDFVFGVTRSSFILGHEVAQSGQHP